MTECESCAPDRLAAVARKVRETADPSRVDVDAEIAAGVLEALLSELPEHFGPEAHAGYTFWLRNRIAALRAGKHFYRWMMTTSYMNRPELLYCVRP